MNRPGVSQRSGQAEAEHNDDSPRCELQKPLYSMFISSQRRRHVANLCECQSPDKCDGSVEQNGRERPGGRLPRRLDRGDFALLQAEKVERICRVTRVLIGIFLRSNGGCTC